MVADGGAESSRYSAIRRQNCFCRQRSGKSVCTRLSDGTRKVTGIAEITGMEGEIVTMQDIFTFRKRGVKETGEVLVILSRPEFVRNLPNGSPLRESAFACGIVRSPARAVSELLWHYWSGVIDISDCGLRCIRSLADDERRRAKQDVIQQRLEAVRQTERRGNASLEVQLLRDEMLSTVPALN